MKSDVYANEEVKVGEKKVIPVSAPKGTNGVIFEDNGETGYFYATSSENQKLTIFDAMHIYSVEGVTDSDEPASVAVLWTSDGLKAALLINEFPHAVFDFEAQVGYCQNAFPPASPDSSWRREDWNDSLREIFM